MARERILERIIRESGVPDLLEALCDRLTPTDLQSLLLEVYRQKAESIRPGMLLAHYEDNRFTRLSKNDPREMLQFDSLAYSLLPDGFEPVELSPLAPMGTHSVPATCHQDKIVSTCRNTEVVADATNVMALECAHRRRNFLRLGQNDRRVKLATSHRHVRAQGLANPNHTAHFRLFAMVTAGRDRGNFLLEMESLEEQLGFWLEFMRRAQELGLRFADIRLRLTDLTPKSSLTDRLRTKVMAPISSRFPHVSVTLFPERRRGRGYYQNACFRINARTPNGEDIEIGDGGFTNWTQQLLSNAKERLLVSGFGCELSALFRTGHP